jgi:hypothetical protein
MATHDTHNLGHPVDNQGEYPTQRVSQRRSSSSSSGSHTGQTTAPPQSHTSSHPPISFPNVTNGTTEVPAFQLHQKNVPISSVLKGKQKESVPMDRPASFHTGEGGKREYRSTWIVDEESSMIGADAWVERDRVVLVLGREFAFSRSLTDDAGPTPDSLSPLLYNPQYASTLILIALSSPSAAFTQLAAQTTADRTTYPIVQLVDLKSIAANNPAHPLPSLLEKAAKIATQWRASLSGPSTPRMSWMGAGSRTSSAESISSGRYIPPPSSNRSSMAPPSAYRRSSEISTESTYDSRRMSAPVSRSRPEPSSRKSSFFGLGKTSENKASPPASPFDAVLHFIPPASEFSASRALQEMLQRSILLTSTVVPTLAKRDMSSSKDVAVDSIPVSLVHILPANPPAALPTVIENFVLSLLSGFQSQSERPLTSVVIHEAAWLHPAERDIMSGSDLVLFGGAKVRPTELPDGTTRTKSRAFIPFWAHQGPPMAVAPNPDFTRPDYSTLVPVAPTADKPLPPRRVQRSPPSSRPSTRNHRSGLSQVLLPSDLEDISSLDAPELDHAPSSASSQSHEATTPMTSTYGSELGAPSLNEAVGIKVDTGRKSGFGSFVRRFGKKK